MGKNVSLDPVARAWARARFAAYYRGHRVSPPERFARREFAAFPFSDETLMRRHATFRSAQELSHYLGEEVPRHIYYSSAYYRTPEEPTMARKEWLGADVIFDLDADHLRQAQGRDYPGQLALAKERFLHLVDDFLLGDFGLSLEQVALVFSGGRGYHAHVRDPAFLDLSSPERRELVDYILGTGVDPSDAIIDQPAPDRVPRTQLKHFRALRDPDEGGWPARISGSLLRKLERWETLGVEGTLPELVGLGIPLGRARKLAHQLVEGKKSAQIRATRSLDVFRGAFPQELFDLVVRDAAVEVQGETDAPVTTDIHRLIRLPGSLHGGTGLRVLPLERDELDAFDPLRDAPPDTDGAAPVAVQLTEKVDYPFRDGRIHAAPGEALELEPAAALFLLLRGEATLPPGLGR
ncbi:MAG TPA: DNA primase small subunit PriS [Thermoplasmata archaeon]|nr:DNA primase small subunit PriS [Thermoplasmata archaeon]